MVIYTLTVGVAPKTGSVGEVFDFSGRLTLNGSAYAGILIKLVLEGVRVADAVTGSDGRYSCLWLANRSGTLSFHTKAAGLAVSEPIYLFLPEGIDLTLRTIVGALPVVFVSGVVLTQELNKFKIM